MRVPGKEGRNASTAIRTAARLEMDQAAEGREETMSLPLLQLSSISSLFNIGLDIGGVTTAEMTAGELAIGTALAGSWLYFAVSDPHWNEIRKEGHFDGAIDDDCARLAGLTDEQRASIEELPEARREFFRRMITSSHGWRGIVSRLRRESARKALTA